MLDLLKLENSTKNNVNFTIFIKIRKFKRYLYVDSRNIENTIQIILACLIPQIKIRKQKKIRLKNK